MIDFPVVPIDDILSVFLGGGGGGDGSALAGGDTEGRNALRKNKAFLQLRREMEQRNRMKRKTVEDEEAEEVFYVDRDRSAAVVLGNKDIKNDLKVALKMTGKCFIYLYSRLNCSTRRSETGWRTRPARSRCLRTSTMKPISSRESRSSSEGDEIDCSNLDLAGSLEKFLNNNRVLNIRSGDPSRALVPLSKACQSIEAEDDDTPFVMRSKSFTKLGLYQEADEDADIILKMNPGCPRSGIGSYSPPKLQFPRKMYSFLSGDSWQKVLGHKRIGKKSKPSFRKCSNS